MIAAFNLAWPVFLGSLTDLSLWSLVVLGAAGFLLLAAGFLLWRSTRKTRFPRAEIEVEKPVYIPPEEETEDEGVLLFNVRVTNRETSQRMNLELTFLLRMFTDVSRLNPGLKPMETTLFQRPERMKTPPPKLLDVDPQRTVTHLYATEIYLLKSYEVEDHEIKLGTSDEFALRIQDLVSGASIQMVVPSVWSN